MRFVPCTRRLFNVAVRDYFQGTGWCRNSVRSRPRLFLGVRNGGNVMRENTSRCRWQDLHLRHKARPDALTGRIILCLAYRQCATETTPRRSASELHRHICGRPANQSPACRGGAQWKAETGGFLIPDAFRPRNQPPQPLMVVAVDVVHSALNSSVPEPLLCRRIKRFPVLRIPFARAVAVVVALRHWRHGSYLAMI